MTIDELDVVCIALAERDAEIERLRAENASLRYDAALPIVDYEGLPLPHIYHPDFLKGGEKP
jgi:hypothetical protein